MPKGIGYAGASLAGRRKRLPGPPKTPAPAPALPPVDTARRRPFKKLVGKIKRKRSRRRAMRTGRA